MDSKRVYIVPHSHWDREWYFTIEDSNLILAENMSHLLTVLEKDESYTGYVFDGQLSVVEEYLKVEPDNKNRIKELVTAKRLFIGPWYTQADSLLVHKESLVRNLLYGVLGAEAFGHSMNVGYLPDIFGQNTYLPSVFHGFGIDYSVLQRGIYTDELDGDVHFKWESPDGLGVKSALLPLGYGPGKFLETGEGYRNETLYPLVEKISHLSSRTDHILFPSGGDQVLIREHFPETVNQLNAIEDGHTYVLSDYETYMEETWDDEAFTHIIKGELIGTELSRMHRTIRSQRYDIKYWNSLVEHKLINQLEPLAVIGEQQGLTYPKARIDDMWKELFDVHAHDSIGGCNSDDTNRAIVERLKKVNQQVDGLLNIIKKQLTQAVVKGNNLDKCLLVFNTQAKTATQSFEVTLFTREEGFSLEDAEGKPVPYSLVQSDYVDGGKKVQVTDQGEKQIPLPGYYKHIILVEAIQVPSLGYTTLLIRPGSSNESSQNEEAQKAIENSLYSLVVKDNQLFLTDKTTDLEIEDFITFEDTADAGDSYDYSPLIGSRAIHLSEVELLSVEKHEHVQKMTVLHKGKLPASLNDRTETDSTEVVDFEVETTIELRSDDPFIRVRHTLDNQAKDHRVRVCLNTPVKEGKHSYGDQGYSLIERPLVEDRLAYWKEKGYREAPVPVYTIERFVGFEGDSQAITAFTSGLKEYEVLPEHNQLALTLFRSVGLLGRDDLEWRPGRASGINNKVVETSDAQMIGEWTFDYAVTLGHKSEQELFELADQYNEQILTYQNQKLNTFEERLDRFEIPSPIASLPQEMSLLEISNNKIFISSLKKAEKEKGVIVRLYNPHSQPEQATILTKMFKTVYTTNLKENRIDEVDTLTVPAKGYQTILLK